MKEGGGRGKLDPFVGRGEGLIFSSGTGFLALTFLNFFTLFATGTDYYNYYYLLILYILSSSNLPSLAGVSLFTLFFSPWFVGCFEEDAAATAVAAVC